MARSSRREAGSERSPNTPAWRAVWALYETVGSTPSAIVDAVMSASRADYQAGLTDPSVRMHLAVLLEWPQTTDLLQASTAARYRASRQLSHQGLGSFYGLLAESALHRTIMSAGLPENRGVRVRAFLLELVSVAIDYLVGRDLSGYIGTAALPNVTASLALKAAVIAEARRRVALISVPLDLEAQDKWRTAIAQVWA